MISCLTEHPRVLLASGHISPLTRAWINSCLQQAACQSGQPCPWWPADMVIDGLMLWLEEQDWSSPFRLQQLEARLCQALEGIGYPQVAAEFHLAPPPLRIDLLLLVEEAGTLFELEFFTRLNATLENYLEAGFESFCFIHLDESTDALCGQTRRSSRWKSLRKELNSFLETRLQKPALAASW